MEVFKIKKISKTLLKKILPKEVEIIGQKNLYEEDHETWLALRNLGIGGSDIGGLLNVNKYKRPIDVYLDKTGDGKDFLGNYKTAFGHWQEPTIAERFESKHKGKYTVYECGYTLKSGCLVANVDRLLYDEEHERWGILEIKTAGENSAKNWELDDLTDAETYTFKVLKAPDSYYAQTQHYLETLQLDFAVIAGTVGQKYIESPAYNRNSVEGDLIRKVAEDFYRNHIIPKNPPVADGSENYGDYIKDQYPVLEGLTNNPVSLEEEAEKNVADYVAVKAELDDLKKQMDAKKVQLETYKQLIVLDMQGSNKGYTVEWDVVRSGSVRRGYNEKEFKKDLREIKERYPQIIEEGLLKENYKTKESIIEKFTIKKR